MITKGGAKRSITQNWLAKGMEDPIGSEQQPTGSQKHKATTAAAAAEQQSSSQYRFTASWSQSLVGCLVACFKKSKIKPRRQTHAWPACVQHARRSHTPAFRPLCLSLSFCLCSRKFNFSKITPLAAPTPFFSASCLSEALTLSTQPCLGSTWATSAQRPTQSSITAKERGEKACFSFPFCKARASEASRWKKCEFLLLLQDELWADYLCCCSSL